VQLEAQRPTRGVHTFHPQLLQDLERGDVVVEALGGDPAYAGTGERPVDQGTRRLGREPLPTIRRDDVLADLDRPRLVGWTVKPGFPDEGLVRRVDDETGRLSPRRGVLGTPGDARQHPGEVDSRPRLRDVRPEHLPQLRPVLQRGPRELRRQRHQRQPLGMQGLQASAVQEPAQESPTSKTFDLGGALLELLLNAGYALDAFHKHQPFLRRSSKLQHLFSETSALLDRLL
jgi:hypothetical protein